MSPHIVNRCHLASRVIPLVALFAFSPLSAQTSVGFSPSQVNLVVGETAIVALTVSDIPYPGLAGFQVSLRFDPDIAVAQNPNEAFRGSISPFASLAGMPFCTAVRGTDPCPDPLWFLVSSGRTVSALPDTIDLVSGQLQFGFGTRGTSTTPMGGGAIGLIEIRATGIGTVTVTPENVLLTTAEEPPQPIPASLATLTVVVSAAAGQAAAE